jgi:dTDP-4-amino-4,6-dideoxygalactose transaminase
MIYRADLVPEYLKYKDKINSAILRVLNSGKYTLGNEVDMFQNEFASYNQASYCLGVASGTDAIILALRACGVLPGDEVITSAFTAYATISAIISVGATPVFVDVCENSYLIDIDKVGLAVGPKTKAVIPVHIFGNVVDIDRLRLIVGNNVSIIEDACQAHGSMIEDNKAGSLGDIGCFSFYPTKNLGGYGDGGAIITNDSGLYEKISLMRMYGMKDKDHVEIHGMNSRLDELQAAVLREKLPYLDSFNHQ